MGIIEFRTEENASIIHVKTIPIPEGVAEPFELLKKIPEFDASEKSAEQRL